MGVREGVDTNIVAFEGLHERFQHTIRLWTGNRCKAGFQVERGGKVACILGGVAAAVVGQPLDRLRCAQLTEPVFHRFEHNVAKHAATYSGAHNRRPGDDLAVVGVDGEGDRHHLAIPAGKL